MKTYYIKTYGCSANEVDSNLIAGILEELGFHEFPKFSFKNEVEEINTVLSKADVLIVNSCSVRQKSEDKIYGVEKIVNQYEKKFPRKACVVLTGCLVGSSKSNQFRDLKKRTRDFDGYFSSNDVSEFLDILKMHGLIKKAQEVDNRDVVGKQKDKNHAFVNISFGCDNFCSYCIVPYARGKEVSRPEKDILDEIKCLVKNGAQQITLCAQNVNSWGLSPTEKAKIRLGSRKKLPFADLLRKIHQIKGITYIDFISSNPFDFTQDLVNAIKLPKISNYIHIAVQSGNNEVLKKMNRRHTAEEFLNLLARIRKIKPGVEIGTDLIVGFPSETKRQFEDTVKLVKKAKFAVAFIAMYSSRKGTYAQKSLEDNVPLKEKKRRHAHLMKVWKDSKK